MRAHEFIVGQRNRLTPIDLYAKLSGTPFSAIRAGLPMLNRQLGRPFLRQPTRRGAASYKRCRRRKPSGRDLAYQDQPHRLRRDSRFDQRYSDILGRRNHMEGNISLFHQLGQIEALNDMLLAGAFSWRSRTNESG
jgi:hypothetical protein